MTDQQLYIDGVLMDLPENTDVVLDIKSNLFRDVTKMTSNYTYTIQLPRTVHNLSVLQQADRPKSGSRYPYIFHQCRYFRGGVEIIKDGRLNVLSVAETIEVSIYWGIMTAFSKLLESGMKLNDIKTDLHLPFNQVNTVSDRKTATTNGVFYARYITEAFTDDESWQGSFNDIKPKTISKAYLSAGKKIQTGEINGAYVSGDYIVDDEYQSLLIEFRAGTRVVISGAASSGEYRTFAVLDKDKKIIMLAKDNLSGAITLDAPSFARYLIINSKGTQSVSVSLTISKITDSHESHIYDHTKMYWTQPCVTVKWLLDMIAKQSGVSFAFPSEYEDYIRDLVVPLISNKADEGTIEGDVVGTFGNMTAVGNMSLTLTDSITAISQKAGETVSLLNVLSDCTLYFDVQMKYDWDAEHGTWTPTDNGTYSKNVAPYYIEILVKHYDDEGEGDAYNVGAPFYSDGSVRRFYIERHRDLINNRCYRLITGSGSIKLKRFDKVYFNLKCEDGTLYDTKTYDGFLRAGIKVGDSVPVGGNFPIGINLPEIEVKSFVKFLSLITGTFPRQLTNSAQVQFISFASVWANKVNAYDWTRKLIPYDRRIAPRKSEFSVSDYKQHNYYKWKEDDQTIGDYDADLKINNATLDYEQDAWTLPFSASDGNRIPIRTKVTESGGGEYKECKERIMNLTSNRDEATLSFDIRLQEIFDTKYRQLANTVANAHVITERIALRDIDILNFDETKPVYLSQYGAYFAVLEIKTTNSGYCEVTMIELNN